MTARLDTIGKRMNYRLIVLGISKSEFATKTHRSRQVISNWANDVAVPSPGALPSLCRALECSIEWLLEGEPMHKEKATVV